MKNRLSKLLLIILLVVLVATLFVACKEKIDQEVVKAINEYFEGSEVAIQYVVGKYNNVTVVSVKSSAIKDSLQKDTISGIEFDYDRQTLLLAVKEGKVYTLKEAYCNLVFNASTLKAVQTDYKTNYAPSGTYTEIGNEVVLEAKVSMEDLGYVFHGTDLFYVEDDGTETPWDYYDDRVVLWIDNNFNDYRFTDTDFRMVNYKRVDIFTSHVSGQEHDHLAQGAHQYIVIELQQAGKENVLRAIETLRQLDFVMSAQVRTVTRIDETDDRLMEDGEYNAVLVAQDRFTSSWLTGYKVEIINNTLFIDGEEMGKLALGQVSQDNWGYPGFPDDFGIDYLSVVDGVDLASLMSVKNCFVIDSRNIFLGANYFYLISSNNNYYLLCAMKSEEDPFVGTWIIKVYLLDEKVDEATRNALNDHFKDSEVEVQHSFGEYNGATVVLVKSNAIADSLRKDTINGIELDYARQTQLLVVKDSQVYTLKDAYLNLLLDSTALHEIQTTYNDTVKLESGNQYAEIGDEIVLEAKYTMEDVGYVFRDTDLFLINSDGTETQWYYYDDMVFVTIDSAFKNYYFTDQDFAMVNYRRIEFFPKYAYDMYKDNFPEGFHHIILIELKDAGIDNILRAIETLSNLEFVLSAQVRIVTQIDGTNDRHMEDGEYNAVLVAQSIFFSSWYSNIKVEIKNNKLYIEDEEMGELLAGKLSPSAWDYPDSEDNVGIPLYNVVDGVDLNTLKAIEDCFVIDIKDNYNDCYYLISSNNNFYLLWASRIGIYRVYLLDEIGGGN